MTKQFIRPLYLGVAVLLLAGLFMMGMSISVTHAETETSIDLSTVDVEGLTDAQEAARRAQLISIIMQLIASLSASAQGGSLSDTPISIGASVAVTTPNSTLNVRADGAATAAERGKQQHGARGTVIAGPKNAGGLTWWEVNFASGADGWVAEGNGAQSWLQVFTPTQTAPVVTSAQTPNQTSLPSATAQGTLSLQVDGFTRRTENNITVGAAKKLCEERDQSETTKVVRCVWQGTTGSQIQIYPTEGAAVTILADGTVSAPSTRPTSNSGGGFGSQIINTLNNAVGNDEERVYEGPTGELIIRVNGERTERKRNITAEESYEDCEALARRNPTAEVTCLWDGIQVFPAGLGRLVVTQDGVQVGQSSDRTRQDALNRCRERAANNPDKRISCTFDGRELFKNYGQVELFVNGRKEGSTMSRIKENAFDMCVRRANDGDKKTPKETIRCTYDGTELYPGVLTNRFEVFMNGTKTGQRSNMTRQASVARCKELSDGTPKQGYRCLWQGIQVAVHGTLVVDFSNRLDSAGKIKDPNSDFAGRLARAERENGIKFINLIRDGENSSKYLQAPDGISEAQAKKVCAFMNLPTTHSWPYARVCWWNRMPVDETNFQKGTQWLPRDVISTGSSGFNSNEDRGGDGDSTGQGADPGGTSGGDNSGVDGGPNGDADSQGGFQ